MFNKKFKKLDIIIVCLVVISSFLIFFSFSDQNGNVVEVYVLGTMYGKYPLYDNNSITIDTEKGNIVLCIEKGKVYVVSADCADMDCVKQGMISGKGKSIVCLPLETVIKIGEEEYEIAY